MSETTTAPRHRVARRAPLAVLGNAVTGPVTRRAAAAVASSGIVLTMTAGAGVAATPLPQAAPLPQAQGQSETDTVDEAAPVVSVDAESDWTFATSEVSAEAPPPPPPPEPEPAPAPAQQTTVSRGTERTAPATDTQQSSDQGTGAVGSQATTSASGNAVVDIARRYVGTPYVSGGSTPGGFDCSGFTQYVYAQVGVSIPRSSGAQRGAGRVVSASEARPGDLIWWPGHVGIYTGNGNHIAARSPGTALYESQIFSSNGTPTFIRVIE